jgi:tetratricopeptide (TPR) repeat protein
MHARKTTNKSIFVSSTFRDMQAERDALRDFVLPRVNEFAARYGRAVEIIDLRWGVDTAAVSEEDQNRKVLRTCLDEIERSRPFFLGLIGDRYGWTPPRTYMEAVLKAAQFSLEEPNMSVTALEIEYGVLRCENPPVCLFYFRKSPDYALMPESLRLIYQDKEEGQTKLTKLKKEIRARFGKDIKSYKAEIHENGLSVSKDWADMVAADIIAKLQEEWGEASETPPTWKEQERDMQDSFRDSRTSHFAGRAAAISDMAAFCLGEKTKPQPLMIQGEAGSGKSGLLCKVMDEIEDKCLLLPFSCGISPRSSLIENMLRYFISLLYKKLTLEDDSDDITKFQDLKDRFSELLFAASAKMRVVAVVDALDQLAGSDEARRMLWISGKLPENFRLLCSIIEGPETEAVKQLGGEVRPVPPINTEDEAEIIHSIAKRHHKEISNAVVEYILQKQTPNGGHAARNPLYLSLITQDLVMMDRYELDIVQKYMETGASQPQALARFMWERIDETPGDPGGAYLAVLDRLEKLIGRDFVRGVCGMIAISRSGLRESDMEGAFKELGMEFNTADFSWLRQMMRGHVLQGDMQQWDFSHQSLRRAIREKMPEELERLNEGIAEYFLSVMAQDDFATREIMHHLCAADRPDIAAEVIALYYGDHYTTLKRGLADIYTEHGEEGTAFLLKVPNSAKNVEETRRWYITETIRCCLPLLPENTRLFRIELMLAALVMIDKQEDVDTRQVKAAGETTIANLYTETGQTKEAEEYYRKSLDARVQIYEQTGTTVALRDLVVSYDNMGRYLTVLGLTEEAGEYIRKLLNASEQIYEQTGTTEALSDLSVSYNFKGYHLTMLGLTEEAGEYYRKSLNASEQVYEQTGTMSALRYLSSSYTQMGYHLKALGKTEEAEEYFRKSLNASEQVYEQTGTMSALMDLSSSYSQMGNHLTDLGRTEEAGEYILKCLNASEQIYEQTDTMSALSCLSSSYILMGDHLTALGQTEEAGEYYRKSLDASVQVYGQTGTMFVLIDLLRSYERMGDHLHALGKTEEAGEYYRKSLDASVQVYGQTNTVEAQKYLSISYKKMGEHLTAMGRMEEAKDSYTHALGNWRKLAETNPDAYLPDVAWTLYSLANLQNDTNRYAEAEPNYSEALEISRKLAETNPDVYLPDVAITLYNLAKLQRDTNRYAEAEANYTEVLEIRQKLAETNPDVYLPDVAMTLYNLANLQRDTKRYTEAEENYTEALGIYRKLVEASPDAYLPDLASCLDCLAFMQWETGRNTEEESNYAEALEIYRKLAEADPDKYLPDLTRTLENLIEVKEILLKKAEAEELKKELAEINLKKATRA